MIFYVGGGLCGGLLIGALCGKSLVAEQGLVVGLSIAGMLVCFVAGIAANGARATRKKPDGTVSLQKQDLILQKGVTYQVSKRGPVHPGEYTLIAVNETETAFNLRVNDYVKEYRHNSTLILAEGDTIAACSGNVILR